jgi:hypothetical protein
MGDGFVDKYSMLHFMFGFLMNAFGMGFTLTFVLAILFEWIENTPTGVKFIDEHLSWFWPGGKLKPDSFINKVGDVFFVMMGWVISSLIFP